MKKQVLKYFLKIVVLVLVCSYTLDKIVFVVIAAINDNVYTGQSGGKLNHFFKVKDNLDIIVVGSSRANHHVDVTKFSRNAFNIGMDGTKMAYASTLIKTLPKNREQTIFMHISTITAFSKEYVGKDIRSLKSKYNQHEAIQNEIDALKQNNSLQRFYWSLSYNGAVLGILKNRLFPNYDYTSYSGYDPLYVSDSQKESFTELLSREKKEDCSKELVLNEIYANYLRDLKEFCSNNQKTLILFTAPTYMDLCKEDNIKLHQVLQNYGFEYYDFTDFFKKNNSIEYWRDNTHLSHIGAELFSVALREKISLKNKQL